MVVNRFARPTSAQMCIAQGYGSFADDDTECRSAAVMRARQTEKRRSARIALPKSPTTLYDALSGGGL
jgi:hypothetical protein